MGGLLCRLLCSQLCRLLCSQLCRSLCGLLCRLLGCLLSRIMRRLLRGPLSCLESNLLSNSLCLTRFFFQLRRFGYALRLDLAFCLHLLMRSSLFLLNCLLHPQTRLLPRLRPRFRKVPIFCSVQIGPRIKRRYIFRCVILVMQRPAFSHISPQNLPLSLPNRRSCLYVFY